VRLLMLTLLDATPKSALPGNRLYCGVIIAIVCLLFFPAEGHSGTIKLDYNFEPPLLKSVVIDGQVFTRVTLPGAPNSGEIGCPALPGRGAKILVPYGEEVVAIEVVVHGKQQLKIEDPVEPVGRPFPLSATLDEIPPLVMDSAIYALNSPIPENRYAKISNQIFRGYQILILKLNPVDYIPATGTLSYYSNISVTVTTNESGRPSSFLRNSPVDRAAVLAKVDNPAELFSYAFAAKPTLGDYEMLIISPDGFVNAYEPLKEYHDANGVLTEIHSLSQIGSTNPHDIRDYIRQEFQNNGIEYVLLGGDDELIPALDLYVISFDRPDAPIEYAMPGDFYFSCLDGTFNYDGDGQWGESTDGEGGGEIDLFPDIHLGRIAAGSVDEVNNMVNKTLAYVASESPALQKIVLAGEQLTFGGSGEYGGYAMDEMVDASDAHGFLTYGFPSDVYEIDKLYDVTRIPSYWPPSEILLRINNGVHVVDHLGHSGGGYAMRTDTSMLRQGLINTDYCFIYAEGCSAGKFDVMDCWAEYVTVKLERGAFGCIANSRLGLGARSTAHPVHVFNREFWDAIYHTDEGKPQLGRAISDARADHIYHINDPGIRWTFYEINLFGDPALAIKPAKSIVFTFPNGVPEMVPPNTDVRCTVQVSGVGTGVPIPGSGRLHYSIDGGDLVTVPMNEHLLGTYEAALPEIECGNELQFYFSAEEETVGWRYYPQAESAYRIPTVSQEVILFEDDFETDQGWIISGGLWERGIPQGLGGEDLQYPVPDPTEGCNGPQVLGYNLNGDYENNLPAAHVTSPAINCLGMENIHLRFCRWLGVEQPIYDQASISVSNDGENWSLIWEHPATIGDLEWLPAEYDISSYADNQPTVYLRWTMGPTDGGLRFGGWNIDDVRVISYQCVECDCPDFCDLNLDAAINPLDVVFLVNYVYLGYDLRRQLPDCPGDNGDWNCDGAVNPVDVVRMVNFVYLTSGIGPCHPCNCSSYPANCPEYP